MTFKKISVLGDGGWGTTLAILLHKKGYPVLLWSAFEAYAKVLDKTRRNPNFLKGVNIPDDIRITSDISEALDTSLLVVATPSEYLRGVLNRSVRYYDQGVPVLSVVKGIEDSTLCRMSEVISDVLRPRSVAVLSGPTIAYEVASGVPTTAVVSSKNSSFMLSLQELFTTTNFRVYTNRDIVGVELGGSLKNVIAIACGISDGLGFGTNTKAAIVSRGLAEMGRLGVSLGADSETFAGISGLGDLVTTCFNSLSRNHYVGEKIGRGLSLKETVSHMKMVAEGVPTAKAAYKLAKKQKVETPIINEIHSVLFKNKSPLAAVKHLMMREMKPE